MPLIGDAFARAYAEQRNAMDAETRKMLKRAFVARRSKIATKEIQPSESFRREDLRLVEPSTSVS